MTIRRRVDRRWAARFASIALDGGAACEGRSRTMTDTKPPFTVHTDACFDEDGVWQIEARVTYRDRVPGPGDQLLGEARLSLLMGIARQGLRGRALGATRVIVHLDAGDGPKTIDLDDLLKDSPSVH
jgi:hypothetical protein